tara:strand:- start:33418 stop:33975 length:558 start_codon:yes stop_codon:yes gene_type:complete
MRRFRKFREMEESEATFELDLSPLLALMVTLIPIMLLATVFVRVTIIETEVPQVVKKAIEEDRNKKKREVTIHLHMNEKGFDLMLKYDGRTAKNLTINKTSDKKWDLDKLHKSLLSFKTMHPDVFRVDLFPAESVSYQDIVKVIDEARTVKEGEPKVKLLDKETNKTVETEIMFPDVVFSNVMEG